MEDKLIEIRELYGKARKYLEDEWKKDPETEPYKSKYKAMEYLKTINEIISDNIDKVEENIRITWQGMLSVVLLQMGVISIDTEEMSAGERYFGQLLKIVVDEQDPRFVLIILTAKNQLGILWCQRSEHEKAKVYLEECERLYLTFIASGQLEAAMSLNDHFEPCKEDSDLKGCDEIEKVHTLTKFYLAQIYGKLGDSMKSAIYCHETLRRQLECKQYDAIDWALNSATLSQYFMERKLYTLARHHLAAASYMLDLHEDALKTLELVEEEMEAKKEELKHRSADVSRCWAKYGIFLLIESKNGSAEDDFQDDRNRLENCWFPSLELSSYENQMSDILLTDFDSARDVMLVTQKFLTSAKQYYSLEDHASDYVQIVQDHSSLIRHLSWFEKDEARLCKMHKKRINMLEEVLKELNPQYYLHVCRALWFELGETYHDLMNIKKTRIRENVEVIDPAALAKVNQLSTSSIRNFNLFVDSVKNKQGELPDSLPEDLLRPTLIAHFFLGRLHYHLVNPDKRQMLSNTHKAFCCFKYFVDYCKKHPNALNEVQDEYPLGEEMMNLLQLKLKQNVNLIS